jgi:hypothetical protein
VAPEREGAVTSARKSSSAASRTSNLLYARSFGSRPRGAQPSSSGLGPRRRATTASPPVGHIRAEHENPFAPPGYGDRKVKHISCVGQLDGKWCRKPIDHRAVTRAEVSGRARRREAGSSSPANWTLATTYRLGGAARVEGVVRIPVNVQGRRERGTDLAGCVERIRDAMLHQRAGQVAGMAAPRETARRREGAAADAACYVPRVRSKRARMIPDGRSLLL